MSILELTDKIRLNREYNFMNQNKFVEKCKYLGDVSISLTNQRIQINDSPVQSLPNLINATFGFRQLKLGLVMPATVWFNP